MRKFTGALLAVLVLTLGAFEAQAQTCKGQDRCNGCGSSEVDGVKKCTAWGTNESQEAVQKDCDACCCVSTEADQGIPAACQGLTVVEQCKRCGVNCHL